MKKQPRRSVINRYIEFDRTFFQRWRDTKWAEGHQSVYLGRLIGVLGGFALVAPLVLATFLDRSDSGLTELVLIIMIGASGLAIMILSFLRFFIAPLVLVFLIIGSALALYISLTVGF